MRKTFQQKGIELGRVDRLRERIAFIQSEFLADENLPHDYFEPEWGNIAKELDEWEAKNA